MELGWLEKPRKSRFEAEVKSRLWSGLLKCKKALVRAGLIAFEEIVAGELKKGNVLQVWRVSAIQEPFWGFSAAWNLTLSRP